MLLPTTSAKIEFVLGEAHSTNQIPCVASYFDSASTPSASTQGSTSNDTTQVTAVSSPGASTVRQINEMTVCNTDTINHTVSVRYNDGTNTFILQKATLTTGQSLVYSKQFGWIIVPAYSAGQIPGTNTNDNASAGNVGEYISSDLPFGSSKTLTSTTALDLTSISLTAGDWDVWGSVAFDSASGTTTATLLRGWISSVSTTQPAALENGGALASAQYPATLAISSDVVIPIGMARFSLSTTTTLYLTARAFFSTAALTSYGFIGARRVR